MRIYGRYFLKDLQSLRWRFFRILFLRTIRTTKRKYLLKILLEPSRATKDDILLLPFNLDSLGHSEEKDLVKKVF